MDTASILDTAKPVYKQNDILFVEHFTFGNLCSNIKHRMNCIRHKLYKIFWLLFPFQIKIAIEPEAFHYTGK